MGLRLGSVGCVGTDYDDALTKSTIGLHDAKLLHRRQFPWNPGKRFGSAIACWFTQFDQGGLHAVR